MERLNKGDLIDLKIEKIVNEGSGLAHYDGFAVFVSGVMAGELVKCRILSSNKSYAKAELVEILETSPHRIKPFCPIFNACGGCQWQFMDYEEQLVQKRLVVKDTIERIFGKELEILPVLGIKNNKNYRQKIQLPISQTKNSKRFLIGYYKENSHELVNVKYCPIQPEYLNEVVEYIRQKASELGLSAYCEKTKKGALRHIVFRNSTSEGKAVLTMVVNSDKVPNEVKTLAESVFKAFEQIKGVVVNLNTSGSNLILTDEFCEICGESFIYQTIDTFTFKISAGSFFQVNIEGARHLLDGVKKLVAVNTKNPTVLDAYCGVGSFGIWLKDIAKEIWLVEQAHSSIEDAKVNIELNNVKNAKIFEGDVKKIFEEFIQSGKEFDVVVIDPPRKGCDEDVREQLMKLAKKYIVYVSCNPATLARDLRFFCDNGFSAESVQPVDMFCHSYHVESVVLLKRKNNNTR